LRENRISYLISKWENQTLGGNRRRMQWISQIITLLHSQTRIFKCQIQNRNYLKTIKTSSFNKIWKTSKTNQITANKSFNLLKSRSNLIVNTWNNSRTLTISNSNLKLLTHTKTIIKLRVEITMNNRIGILNNHQSQIYLHQLR